MKLFTRGVSAARLSIYTAAFAAGVTTMSLRAEHTEPPVDPATVEGSVIALINAVTYWKKDGLARPDPAHDFPATRIGDACFDDPLEAPEAFDPIRHSVVHLISTYDNGMQSYGSGTIIAGSDGADPNGFNRILTAAHVVNPESFTPDPQDPELRVRTGFLLDVHAFDSEGRYLASLQPVLMSMDLSNVVSEKKDARSLYDDVAVLQVTAFGPEIRADWNSRGLTIASTQPSSAQLVYGSSESIIVNSGTSGAPLIDESLRVSGVLTNMFNYPGAPISEAYNSDYFGRIRAAGEDHYVPPEIRNSFEIMTVDDRGLTEAALGVVGPLTQTEILESLGSDPRDIALAEPSQAMSIAGYPHGECAHQQVQTASMRNYTSPLSLMPERAMAWEVPGEVIDLDAQQPQLAQASYTPEPDP